MKFICYAQDNDSLGGPTEGNLSSALRLHPQCREHLQKWAGDSTLVTPTFYFWGTGFQQQMSQKSLFLTLLHHILRQCPILILRFSPSRCETSCLFNYNSRDWSEPELRRMFKLVQKSATAWQGPSFLNRFLLIRPRLCTRDSYFSERSMSFNAAKNWI